MKPKGQGLAGRPCVPDAVLFQQDRGLAQGGSNGSQKLHLGALNETEQARCSGGSSALLLLPAPPWVTGREV